MSLPLTFFCLLVLVNTLPTVYSACDDNNPNLFPIFWWNSMDYTYDNDAARQKDIEDGVFIKENVIPVGLEVWKHKMFVTLPRWKNGVPASLAYFDKSVSTDSPKLIPYPNWDAHNLDDNNKERIVSPFRIQADTCDRLWILDTGVEDIIGNFTVVSPSQIIVYDLKTDKRILTYTIPNSQLTEHTFFANILVDVLDCSNTFAYLADLGGYLVIYDLKANKSWQVDNKYMKLDQEAIDFRVNGYDFQFKDGVFGLAMTEQDPKTKDRTVFFHAFSSFKQNKVLASVLRDEVMSQDENKYSYIGTRGPMSQANAAAVDVKSGVLLYTQVNHDAIGCWNYRTYKESILNKDNQDFLDQNHTTLIFPNDVKVTAGGEVWVLSDKMTDFTTRPKITGKRPDLSVVNFRILTCQVDTLIKNTKCAPDSGRDLSFNSRSGASGVAAMAATMLLPFVMSHVRAV